MIATRAQTASAKAAGLRSAPLRVRGAVRCNASLQQQAKKAAAFVAAAPAMLAASPAMALVDERLNGDGVGLPFGVNEPILGWVIVGVAGLVWAVYFAAQKDFGDFEDEDSGVGL